MKRFHFFAGCSSSGGAKIFSPNGPFPIAFSYRGCELAWRGRTRKDSVRRGSLDQDSFGGAQWNGSSSPKPTDKYFLRYKRFFLPMVVSHGLLSRRAPARQSGYGGR